MALAVIQLYSLFLTSFLTPYIHLARPCPFFYLCPKHHNLWLLTLSPENVLQALGNIADRGTREATRGVSFAATGYIESLIAVALSDSTIPC